MNGSSPQANISVLTADSDVRWQCVLSIRQRVFAEEQSLVDLGITDADDQSSFTLIAYHNDLPVCTGRLTPPIPGRSAYLSWIATLPEFRGQGIATHLVEQLVRVSDRETYPELQLAAQTHAIGLYEQFGFIRLGNPYVVRGIPHQAMTRKLQATSAEL